MTTLTELKKEIEDGIKEDEKDLEKARRVFDEIKEGYLEIRIEAQKEILSKLKELTPDYYAFTAETNVYDNIWDNLACVWGYLERENRDELFDRIGESPNYRNLRKIGLIELP